MTERPGQRPPLSERSGQPGEEPPHADRCGATVTPRGPPAVRARRRGARRFCGRHGAPLRRWWPRPQSPRRRTPGARLPGSRGWPGCRDGHRQEQPEPEELVRRAVDALGGMKRFVSRGDIVAVKPNIGWDRMPVHAANTNPRRRRRGRAPRFRRRRQAGHRHRRLVQRAESLLPALRHLARGLRARAPT